MKMIWTYNAWAMHYLFSAPSRASPHHSLPTVAAVAPMAVLPTPSYVGKQTQVTQLACVCLMDWFCLIVDSRYFPIELYLKAHQYLTQMPQKCKWSNKTPNRRWTMWTPRKEQTSRCVFLSSFFFTPGPSLTPSSSGYHAADPSVSRQWDPPSDPVPRIPRL